MIGIPNNLGIQDGYEIEARIGTFRGKRFTSNVDSKDFYRVLEHFLTHTDEIYSYVPQETSIRTEEATGKPMPYKPDIVTEVTFQIKEKGRPQRIRESFIEMPNLQTPRFYSTKRTLDNVDFVDYFTRFSIAKEQDLSTTSPVPAGTLPQSLRIKHRWSFALADQQADHPLQPYRVDLTHVTGWYLNDRNNRIPINTHEIELEVIYKPIKSAQHDLWPGVHFMLELVQNTQFPVTAATVSSVVQGFNDVFSDEITSLERAMKRKNPRWFFNRSWRLFNVVNKPINLKINALYMPELLAITDKADGERRLMYIRLDGAYLLYPPNEVLRYLRIPVKGQDDPYYIQPEHAKSLNDTVIDGELVLLDDGTRDYLAFDLLVDRGVDIRQLKFTDRIERLKDLLAKNPINITMKEFHPPALGNFYTRTNKVLDTIDHKPYGNDGLIFNNINDTYSSGNVYKWKPPDKLTIDLEINQISPDTFEIYVKGDRAGPKRAQFKGTVRYPMNGEMVVNPPIINDTPLATGQIIEVGWDSEQSMFIPFRIRFDRDTPNNYSTAIDVWRDIMNPLLESTIRGYDLKIMRYYHNVVKRNMLERCEKGTIIDIGSGRGGDLHKWKNLKVEVLAIEPNAEFLQEFHYRLLESEYKPAFSRTDQGPTYKYVFDGTVVTLMQGFGQDTKKIVDAYKATYGQKRATDSADCIAIFNALTFFFDNESSLDSLVTTIDELLRVGGYFMGMVMDGTLVRQALVKHALLKETISKLGADQYFNLDTKSRINEKSFKKLYKNNKWRLVSKNQTLLKKTVEELEEPDPKEIGDHGWSISRTTPFTASPYGNEIKINLGADTIVHDQIEYLVDFDELTRKLAEKNIILKDTFFLSNNAALSSSQEALNDLYRSFTFVRASPLLTKEQKKITVYPLTGTITAKMVKTRQQLRASKVILKRAETDLQLAQDKLQKIADRIKKGTKMTPEKGQALANDRRQLKMDVAALEKKIQENKDKLKEHQAEIKEAEKELAEAKPVTLTDPRYGERPPRPFVKPKAKRLQIAESRQVISEYEYAENKYAAVDVSVKMLKPEEKKEVNIKNIDFVRIGTVDGVCVIAALLRAGFSSFILNQNDANASALTKEQLAKRKSNIAQVLEKFNTVYFKNAYKRKELLFLKKHYKTWKDAAQVLENCQNWQWLDLWGVIAAIFKLNITVITVDNLFTAPNIYKTGDKYDKTAVIYNSGGVFDTIAQRDAKNNLVTVFKKEDITINQLTI